MRAQAVKAVMARKDCHVLVAPSYPYFDMELMPVDQPMILASIDRSQMSCQQGESWSTQLSQPKIISSIDHMTCQYGESWISGLRKQEAHDNLNISMKLYNLITYGNYTVKLIIWFYFAYVIIVHRTIPYNCNLIPCHHCKHPLIISFPMPACMLYNLLFVGQPHPGCSFRCS